jgi:anti-sigma regulatory factor (Ser/Thr protein kinase)
VEALIQADHRRQDVRVEEDAGALRRAAARMAAGRAGVRAGEAELVATELATNIVRHAAPGGYVLYRPVEDGIELLAVDRGPGLRRLAGWRSWASPEDERAPAPPLRGGGLGVGLRGVERIASTFDLYSTRGAGTVVLARLGERRRHRAASFRWGAVNVPVTGDGDSGDGWAVTGDGHLAAVVVDGLGHGEAASLASRAAIAAFAEGPVNDLEDFVRRAHEAMLGTRGGVVGVCSIDPVRDQLTYAGVGNVAGRVLLGGASHSLLSREGVLGTQATAPRARLARYRWGPGAALVLASDGLRSQWDPRSYPGLLAHDPGVVAAALQRDHGRSTDDATVLVVQDLRRAA